MFPEFLFEGSAFWAALPRVEIVYRRRKIDHTSNRVSWEFAAAPAEHKAFPTGVATWRCMHEAYSAAHCLCVLE